MLKILLLLFLLIFTAPHIVSGQEEKVSGSYKTVTISNRGLPVTNAQIKITVPPYFNFNLTRADGSDIRITDFKDKPIPFWLESYNPKANIGHIWIRPAYLPEGTTNVKLWYGKNSGILSDFSAVFYTGSDTFNRTSSSVVGNNWVQSPANFGEITAINPSSSGPYFSIGIDTPPGDPLDQSCPTPHAETSSTNMVRIPDGRLMLVYASGFDLSKNQGLYISSSSDEGETWTTPSQIHRGFRSLNPVVLRVNNRIYLYWNWDLKNNGCPSREDGTYQIFSDDNGKSWSKPQKMPLTQSWGLRANPVTLFDGTVILPLYGENDVGVLVSKDRAKTWKRYGHLSAQDRAKLTEGSVVEVTPNLLKMYIRDDLGGPFWKSTSTDGGKTWSAPEVTALQGGANPPEIRKFSDGTILLLWGNALDKSYHAYTSTDGENWTELPKPVFADAAHANPTPRYPTVLERADRMGVLVGGSSGKTLSVSIIRVTPASLTTQALFVGDNPTSQNYVSHTFNNNLEADLIFEILATPQQISSSPSFSAMTISGSGTTFARWSVSGSQFFYYHDGKQSFSGKDLHVEDPARIKIVYHKQANALDYIINGEVVASGVRPYSPLASMEEITFISNTSNDPHYTAYNNLFIYQNVSNITSFINP